jgi:hypothetical protein
MSDQEIVDRVAALEGQLLATQGVLGQLLQVLRGRNALSAEHCSWIHDSCLTALEAGGATDTAALHARKAVDRIVRAVKR